MCARMPTCCIPAPQSYSIVRSPRVDKTLFIKQDALSAHAEKCLQLGEHLFKLPRSEG